MVAMFMFQYHAAHGRRNISAFDDFPVVVRAGGGNAVNRMISSGLKVRQPAMLFVHLKEVQAARLAHCIHDSFFTAVLLECCHLQPQPLLLGQLSSDKVMSALCRASSSGPSTQMHRHLRMRCQNISCSWAARSHGA